jgi:hypothetical protein
MQIYNKHKEIMENELTLAIDKSLMLMINSISMGRTMTHYRDRDRGKEMRQKTYCTTLLRISMKTPWEMQIKNHRCKITTESTVTSDLIKSTQDSEL